MVQQPSSPSKGLSEMICAGMANCPLGMAILETQLGLDAAISAKAFFLNANSAAHDLLGEQELVGRSICSIVALQSEISQKSSAAAQLHAALVNGSATTLELPLSLQRWARITLSPCDAGHEAREWRHVPVPNVPASNASAAPECSPGVSKRHTLCIIQDISAHKKHLLLLERALAATAEGIVICDMLADGQPISYCNDAFCSMTGYSREEVVGRNCRFLQGPGTDPAAVARIREAISSQRGCEVQLLNHRRDGTPFINRLRLTPVEEPLSGRVGSYIGVQHDVSELVAAVEAGEQLRSAKAAAEAHAQAKGVFVANMSHELRTPLNGMLATAQLLLASRLSPEQRELTETILDSGWALLGVLGDILDFSAMDQGALELDQRPVSLRQAIESCLEMVAPEAAKKSIELAYVAGPRPGSAAVLERPIMGDPVRIRQVLANLLSNAVKFTEGGEVVVTVEVEQEASLSQHGAGTGQQQQQQQQQQQPQEEGVLVHIAVRDTGIGISPACALHLFESFRQGSETLSRRYGGTGLGLALCRRLAQLMSGSVWAESSGLGRGSTFHFTLRAAWADLPGGHHRSSSYSPLHVSVSTDKCRTDQCHPHTPRAPASGASGAAGCGDGYGGLDASTTTTTTTMSEAVAAAASGVASGPASDAAGDSSGEMPRSLHSSLHDQDHDHDMLAANAAAVAAAAAPAPAPAAPAPAPAPAAAAPHPAVGALLASRARAAEGSSTPRRVLWDYEHPTSSQRVAIWTSYAQDEAHNMDAPAAGDGNGGGGGRGDVGQHELHPMHHDVHDHHHHHHDVHDHHHGHHHHGDAEEGGHGAGFGSGCSSRGSSGSQQGELTSTGTVSGGCSGCGPYPSSQQPYGLNNSCSSHRSSSGSVHGQLQLHQPPTGAALAAAGADGGQAALRAALAGLRVLVVCAHAATATQVAQSCGLLGMAAAAAEDAVSGLAAGVSEQYDVAVVGMEHALTAIKVAGWKGRPLVVLAPAGSAAALPHHLLPLAVVTSLPVRHSRLAGALLKAVVLLRADSMGGGAGGGGGGTSSSAAVGGGVGGCAMGGGGSHAAAAGAATGKLGHVPVSAESIYTIKTWRVKRSEAADCEALLFNRRTSLDNSALERSALKTAMAAAAAAAAASSSSSSSSVTVTAGAAAAAEGGGDASCRHAACPSGHASAHSHSGTPPLASSSSSGAGAAALGGVVTAAAAGAGLPVSLPADASTLQMHPTMPATMPPTIPEHEELVVAPPPAHATPSYPSPSPCSPQSSLLTNLFGEGAVAGTNGAAAAAAAAAGVAAGGRGAPMPSAAAAAAAAAALAAAAAGGPPLRGASPSPLPPLRILIAEDNKVNQKVVLKVLQQIAPSSTPCDVVENGLQVLAALETKQYDLILMDIHMPEMDGLEASKRIRESYRTRPDERPHIVALSADTVQALHESCREAGIEAFLTKPFRIEDLRRVMKVCTRVQRRTPSICA